MKNRRGPIAWIQYVLLRAVAAVLAMFPIEWNLATARLFARLWWTAVIRHRRRACEHIRLAYGPTMPESEVAHIACASFEQLAMLAVETTQAPLLLNERTWSRYIRLRQFEQTLQILLNERGAILLTGHYGNWELVGYLLALFGFDITAIMRPLDNAYLNEWVVSVRARRGLRLLDKKGATQSAEEILQSGGVLGFIADQSAGRKGLFVDFFGRPASTYKSIGLLAMTAEVPVIVGYCRRIGRAFKYEMGVERIIEPAEWVDQEDPLRWITQEYTTALEAIVRAQPEQYLWLHRRWKSHSKGRAANFSSRG